MENIVFERDYTETHKKARELHSSEPNVLDVGKQTGFWKAYESMMNAIPKVIVPEDKAAYENLLPRLDALAKRLGGKIRGEVSYDKWQSEINLTLPFFEFGREEDYRLLKDLADKTHLLSVTATDDGQVRVHIMINYFTEIVDTSEITNKMLASNETMAELLEKSNQERLQKISMLADILNPVLDAAEQITGRERGVLFFEMLDFLTPYSGNLQLGLKKYIEHLERQEEV